MKESITLYQELYNQYGYSPKALGCFKGKQFLRYHQLTCDWHLDGAKLLDVGCGFGDFNKYLELLKIKNYNYTGIDIMNDFIVEGQKRYPQSNVDFITGDFTSSQLDNHFDYAFASGTFNLKLEGVDGYDYIYNNMKKMFALSTKAIALDFLSDRVDYKYEYNFNSSPAKILEMAYSLSKNVILKSNYFPFEFAVIISKNDHFKTETTVFDEIEKKLGWLGI